MRITFVLISILFSIPLYSQEPTSDLQSLSLEQLMDLEVVVGASKFEQKTTDAPAQVTIISSDDIRRMGFRNMYELLNSARSFYNTYDRNYDYVGIRGLNRIGNYNTGILITVDGHRINDSLYDTAGFHEDFIIDLENIERVEIIRGPASSLYGSNALFGVINIITQKGQTYNKASVTGEYGSLDTKRIRAAWGKKFESGWDVLISSSNYDSKGNKKLFFEEYSTINDGFYENNDYEKAQKSLLSISKDNFVFQAAYMNRLVGVPTASYSTVFNDPRNNTKDSRLYINLNYVFILAEKLDLYAKLSYDESRYHGIYIYDNPPVVVDIDKSAGKWLTAELRLTSQQSEKNKYVIGVDYRDHFLQTQDNYYDDGTVSLNDKRSNKIWAAYAQDQYQFAEWGILSASLRYDKYQTFGGTTAPRAALVLKPDSSTNTKIIYGQAFRAPNAYELYYHDGYVTQKPTQSLAPEKITNLSLSVERMMTNELRISLHGFHYKVTNLIDATNDPNDGLKIFKNQSSITGQGFEIETEYKTTNGIRANANYTNQKVIDDLSKTIIRASPQNLAKAGIWTSVYNKQVYAGSQLQWVGERFSRGNAKSRDYFLADLVLSTEGILYSGLHSSIGVYNLFDRKYDHPVSDDFQQTKIEQDGRTIRFKLTANF